MAIFEMVKKPATERILPPLSDIKKDLPKEDEELTSNFSDSEPNLDIDCNVVSVLQLNTTLCQKSTKSKMTSHKKWLITSHYVIV